MSASIRITPVEKHPRKPGILRVGQLLAGVAQQSAKFHVIVHLLLIAPQSGPLFDVDEKGDALLDYFYGRRDEDWTRVGLGHQRVEAAFDAID